MMLTFKLQPGDVLLTIDQSKAPYHVLKRWALGSPYVHVYVYLGNVGLIVHHALSASVPMLFQSDGEGVEIEMLAPRYGEAVTVLRLWLEYRNKISKLVEEAAKLAADPQAHYDYACIVKYVLPRLLAVKLGLPTPLCWHQNPLYQCAEAVYQIFTRAGLAGVLDNIPQGEVPLPGDFLWSPLLQIKWTGTLTEVLVG